MNELILPVGGVVLILVLIGIYMLFTGKSDRDHHHELKEHIKKEVEPALVAGLATTATVVTQAATVAANNVAGADVSRSVAPVAEAAALSAVIAAAPAVKEAVASAVSKFMNR